MIAVRTLALAGLVLLVGGCGQGPTTAAQLAYRRGFEAIGAGDWPKAREELLQAKQVFPKDASVLLNLGVVAQHLGRFDEARDYYQQVIDLAPDAVPLSVSVPAAAGKSLVDLARDDMASLPPPK